MMQHDRRSSFGCVHAPLSDGEVSHFIALVAAVFKTGKSGVGGV